MNEMTPEQVQLAAERKAERETFIQALKTALDAAGFTTERTTAAGGWKLNNAIGLIVKKEGVFECPINLGEKYTRWGVKVGDNWLEVGRRGHSQRRYRKLTDETIQTVVRLMQDGVKLHQQMAVSRDIAARQSAEWQKRYDAEMSGLTIPPNVRLQIVQGNGRNAGNYTLKLEGYSMGWRWYDNMTLEQTQQLLVALDRIFKFSERFVVRRMYTDGLGKLRPSYRCDMAGRSEYVGELNDATLYTNRADAEAEAKRVAEKSEAWQVSVLSWNEAVDYMRTYANANA